MSDSSKKEDAAEASGLAQAPLLSIERLDGGGESLQVGDKIPVRLPGVDTSSAKVLFEPAPGSSPLRDQGWLILDSTAPGVSFYLVPIKSGELTLSALVARLKLNSGEEKILGTTRSASFKVASALQGAQGKSEKPPEFLPPVRVAFPWQEAALWGGTGLVAAIAVALLLYRMFRKKRPKPAAPLPEAPRKPEDERALELLDALEREGLWQKGGDKPHYFRASEILKAYFSERYGFDALESTSVELAQGLERRGAGADTIRDVRSLFDLLDRVKFTDHVPPRGEPPEILARARELVRRTRRPPVTASTGALSPEREGPSAF